MQTIGMILKLVFLFFSYLIERDKDEKQRKKECLTRVREAMKKGDPTSVTAEFDRLNRD